MDRPATLSASFVRTVKRPGRYGDGRGSHGLSLLVRPTSNGRYSKTWSQRLYIDAHVVMTAGDSIRLTQATAGKGVTPLTN